MKGQARAPSILLSLNNLLGLMIYGFNPKCIFSWYFFFLTACHMVYLPLGRLLFVINLPLLNPGVALSNLGSKD